MSTPGSFPRSLLNRPDVERRAYFQAYTIAHPRLKEVDEALMRAINEPAGASLLFVYGPTGVGKTTLRLRAQKQLMQEALPTLCTDLSSHPCRWYRSRRARIWQLQLERLLHEGIGG